MHNDEIFDRAARTAKPFSLAEAEARERAADMQANRAERVWIGRTLLRVLIGELIFTGVLVLCQGFHPFGFTLPEWVFVSVVGAAVSQTFFLIRKVTHYLFR